VVFHAIALHLSVSDLKEAKLLNAAWLANIFFESLVSFFSSFFNIIFWSFSQHDEFH